MAQMRQGWPPGRPRGPRVTGRIVWPCSPRRMRKAGQAEEGLHVLAEALAVAHH